VELLTDWRVTLKDALSLGEMVGRGMAADSREAAYTLVAEAAAALSGTAKTAFWAQGLLPCARRYLRELSLKVETRVARLRSEHHHDLSRAIEGLNCADRREFASEYTEMTGALLPEPDPARGISERSLSPAIYDQLERLASANIDGLWLRLACLTLRYDPTGMR
jgi:hypothetical protein